MACCPLTCKKLYADSSETSSVDVNKNIKSKKQVKLCEVCDMKKEKPKLVLSIDQKRADYYLKMHRINELFNFMISHLLANTPENPISHLLILLSRCVEYRNMKESPPLLFDKKHIESLFNTMDPMKFGTINMKQYNNAMKTLGITKYNKEPTVDRMGNIEKTFFCNEAYLCLCNMLKDMIVERDVPK